MNKLTSDPPLGIAPFAGTTRMPRQIRLRNLTFALARLLLSSPRYMKNTSKQNLRMKLRRNRKELQAANETVALFLGPKLLGELRILMRLASPAYSRNGAAREAELKSY